MQSSSANLHVFFEAGKRRTFAGAVEWPGWCRSGSDEQSALQALFDYGPRYAAILQAAQIEFQPAASPEDFVVVERLVGNASTDFGAPNIPLPSDERTLDEVEFLRLQSLLMACWQGFDVAVLSATDRELSKGPRGGGRDLFGIIEHLMGSDASDLAHLAFMFQLRSAEGIEQELGRTRQAILNALARAALGDLPEQGPRGGVIWTARRFVRTISWHCLDHTWEIQDRLS
jgi:hypothetical protein